MKRPILTSLLVLGALVLPKISNAQVTKNLKFEGVKNPSVNLAGFGIGPYQASVLPVGPKFEIFCIDFDNRAQSQWRGRFLTFAEAVSAPNLAGVQRALGNAPAWNVNNLRAAAHLSSQFNTGNTSQWDDIHGAIWSMFSTSSTPHVGTYATYRSTALNFATANPGAFANWKIIVDENAFDGNYAGPLNQTFITVDETVEISSVPEPGTYALLGAGILALGLVQRRRQGNSRL